MKEKQKVCSQKKLSNLVTQALNNIIPIDIGINSTNNFDESKLSFIEKKQTYKPDSVS